MSDEQKIWTFGQLHESLKAEVDLQEDDPDEQFISLPEFIGYYNDGINEAGAEILKIDEDYFLTRDFLLTVEGQSEYAMPRNIYGDKIRGVMFNDGSTRYAVRKIKRKDKFQKIAMFEDPVNSDADYGYYVRNDGASRRKFTLLPPSRETAMPPPLAGAFTPITRWYIRNPNRIPYLGDFVNPENLLPENFNVATGAITVDPIFPYQTGDQVQLSLPSPSFALPAGLNALTTYFVIRLSDTRIKLASTLAAAKAAAKGLLTGDRIQEVPVGDVDGLNVTFTLSSLPFSPSSVLLYQDGVFQRQGEHYTLLGQVITMLTAPLGESAPGAGDAQELDATYYPATDAPTTNPTEVQEVPGGAINGINLVYALTKNPASAASLSLYVDGDLVNQGVDYEINGRTITFYTALAAGQDLDAVYDTSVLFFTDTGTGYFMLRVAATTAILYATEIDIPEFATFVKEWVKANCLFKDGDARLTATVAKLEEQRKMMVETLTDREPDDDNTVELDTTFYEEMS